MGIGDWGLGIAISNPQSPIPILNNALLSLKKCKSFNKLNN